MIKHEKQKTKQKRSRIIYFELYPHPEGTMKNKVLRSENEEHIRKCIDLHKDRQTLCFTVANFRHDYF